MKKFVVGCFGLIGFVVVLIIAVSIGAALFGGGGGGDTTTTTTTGPDSERSRTAELGQAVQDGNFTFTVTGVEEELSAIGGEAFGTRPQGKFVLISVKIYNHGSEPQFVSEDDQYLYDTEGRKASADIDAGFYLPESQWVFDEINPGNTLAGTIVFDVPEDAQPAGIELHDSAFSDGVTVSLRES